MEDQYSAGYDSFLDTVTNIVGILIILVMVVGVRAQHAPVNLVLPEDPTLKERELRMEELQRRSARLVSLRKDILELAQKIEQTSVEIKARLAERDRLALVVGLLKKEYEEKSSQLSGDATRQQELVRALAEAHDELSRLEREAAAQQDRTEVVQLVNYPTPLATPSDHEEIHFVIEKGKIAYIPLDRLLEELVADARRKLYRLLEVPEITGVVGPIGGFKMEYSLVRRHVSGTPGDGNMLTGAYAQLRQWVLVPTGIGGEPVDRALDETSEFRRRLAGYRPNKTVVTLWCYPDGFKDFRRLKDFLHERGYSVAGRPLPEGFPIMGSPAGTKSAAQ